MVDEKPNEGEVLLTEQQIWDILAFARNLYGQTYLTPDLVSGRMRDVTLNPLQPTQDALDSALADPKNNELQLREFSQSFELTSMIYKRLLSYLANMLAFDITYTSNAQPDDYKALKYKKDLGVLERFLDDFDYKKEFKVALREMLRNDAYFACFTDVGDGYVLQELPADYCKITGRWQNGFLFSFNMYWFLLPGVDLDMYPPFFKKKYKELFIKPGQNIDNYKPALPPESRGNSTWVYWVDIPVDVGVCFKLTPELATRLPYFTPLFSDLILQSTMRTLQKNINMAAASKIIMGEVPLMNKDAKVTVKDSIAISAELLGKFLSLVKNAIAESIKVASAPLENIKGISFDGDNEMYDSYLRTALASSGINTNLIFTSNVKPNAIETQLSLNVDEQMMEDLYSQFEAFMDYRLSKITKSFKFRIRFEGTNFFLNRDKRLEVAMSLFDKGIVLPQKIAAAVGMKPSELRKQMEESAGMGVNEMLKPPSFEQQKALAELGAELAPPPAAGGAPGAKGAGRPLKKTSEIGEEGLKTRETAGNVGRGGKVPK